ncbi:MAG: PKD domain-containing protein [Acidobacteriota bacterium]
MCLGLVVLGVLTVSCGDVSTPTQPAGPLVQNESPTASPTPAPIPPAVGLNVFAVVVTGVPSAITVGEAVTFVSRIDHAAGPVTYAWEFEDGQPLMTSSAPAITFGRSGLHHVTLTAHDTATSATAAFEIMIAPRPAGPAPTPPPAPSYAVTLTASPAAVTVQDSATLTATIVALNGAPTPTSYAWDCDGDALAEERTDSATHVCTYPTVGPAMRSSVTVTSGTVTGTGSTTLAVNAAAPLALAIAAAPGGIVAIGDLVRFTATLTSTGGVPTFGISWEWDENGDEVFEFVSPAHKNPDSRVTSYGSAAVFTLKVRATDAATERQAIGTRFVTVR